MSDRRDRIRRIEQLRTIPLLARCTRRELGCIDRLGTHLEVRAGTVLTQQDRTGMECIFVFAGTAEVHRVGEMVCLLGPGAIIGEMALLDGTPRCATVMAVTPMRLLVFTTKEFEQLAHVAPRIEAGLRRVAAERRAANSCDEFGARAGALG